MSSKQSKYHYPINSICQYFKLDKAKLIEMLDNDFYKPIVRDNILKYNNSYWINIKGILYIAYMYRPYSATYDMFLHITRNIDTLSNITTNLGNYLIFNEPDVACYVYIAKHENILKIGCSNNPIHRLNNMKHDSNIVPSNYDFVLYKLIKFPNRTEALIQERELHNKFNKFRIKGEYFTYNLSIDIGVDNDYGSRII